MSWMSFSKKKIETLHQWEVNSSHVDFSSRGCTFFHISTWTPQPLRQGWHPPGSLLPLSVYHTSIFIQEVSSFKLMLCGFTSIYLNLLLSSSNPWTFNNNIVIWPTVFILTYPTSYSTSELLNWPPLFQRSLPLFNFHKSHAGSVNIWN